MRRSPWRVLAAAAAAFVLCGAGQGSHSLPRRPLELIVFPGGFNWPVWVAEARGFFEREKVAVNVRPTPNSVEQLTGLIDGRYDIAITAIDNLIAYDEGQGEAPTAAKPDLVAFMGGDNGFLRLVTAPEVTSFADLKGRQLSVDALTTGYAFVLQKLIERGGLAPGDVEYVKAGGVLQRFEALLQKTHAGTLLISPFEVVAEAKGFNTLASASEVLGPYQGLVGATRREVLRERGTEIGGYIRAYRSALDWLFDPANRADAIAILRKNLPTMSPDLAERASAILLDPKTGFSPTAAIDRAGVAQVLALRSQYGRPQKTLADPDKYLQLDLYRDAPR